MSGDVAVLDRRLHAWILDLPVRRHKWPITPCPGTCAGLVSGW
jgi:hypothetical protein